MTESDRMNDKTSAPPVMADKTESWLCDELGKLGIDASEDNAKYILGIETADELEEYMLELLDGADPSTQKFIKELLVRWRPYKNFSVPNAQVYLKSSEDDAYVVGKTKKKNSPKGSNSKTEVSPVPDRHVNGLQGLGDRMVTPGQENDEGQGAKKKSKFVPLYSKEGQAKSVVQLHGRHVCECQAAKHSLINNCTRCGRVVCVQEGSGPCLFCGNLVCTAEEQEILSRGSKKSEKLRQQLLKNTPSELLNSKCFNGDRDFLPNTSAKVKEDYLKAEKHKEKLLEFDKTSVRRTQVIDDESDYFAADSNKWLSKADREALKKHEEELRSQRHGSRKDRKVTLDFAGRRVLEEQNDASVNMYDVNDEIIQQVHFGARPKTTVNNNSSAKVSSESDYLVNPNIITQAPQYVPSDSSKSTKSFSSSAQSDHSRPSTRIQDRELQEMSDEGMCMSMHQPWASLLVHGIKIHEGRTWYTPHRGRLWIAATAKTPDPQDIAEVEQQYRYLLKNPHLEFPSQYPVGCLLGCVDVVDCMAQDPYREKFPEGESGSQYVFICENPQELIVKFPIKGKHKIYKMDSHIHKAAKKGLR